MTSSKRVLIVGAGPTGLTAAVELARQGIISRIIDRKPQPSPLSRAVGILPSSMEILEPSGVAQAIRDECVILRRAEVYLRNEQIASLQLDALYDEKMSMFALAQNRTESLMQEAFSRYGGIVEYGVEFQSLEQLAVGVRVQTSIDDQTYDLVIGADGVRSQVRDQIGVEFHGYELDGEWSIADINVEPTGKHPVVRMFLLGESNFVLAIPIEQSRYRLISSTADALTALPLPFQVLDVRRSGIFHISVRQAQHYNVGDVYLAGDAAHTHSPVGGRGMNLGIADAAELAERIMDDELDGYHHSRYKQGRSTIALTERLRQAILSKNIFTKIVMRGMVIAMSNSPLLQRLVLRRILDS